MSLSERSADLLMQIIVQIETELVERKLPQDDAEKIARDVCDNLRHTFGGEQFYFPKGADLDTLLRHNQIYKESNGSNHAELARKFDTSIQNIYRILKKGQKRYIDEVQPDLF